MLPKVAFTMSTGFPVLGFLLLGREEQNARFATQISPCEVKLVVSMTCDVNQN